MSHHDTLTSRVLLSSAASDVTTAGPGSLTFARRESRHTVANLGAASARYLLVCTPGGFERMFLRLEASAAGVEPPAEAQKGYPETVMVGPTLFERMERAS